MSGWDGALPFQRPLLPIGIPGAGADRPRPVRFRALAPEIPDAGYLTHGLLDHPARFIPHVPRFCLREYTAPGDWVLDPFAGSATVGVEAVLTGRRPILLDLNPLLDRIAPLKVLPRDEVDPAALGRRLAAMRREAAEPFLPDLPGLSRWYPPDVLERLARYWGWVRRRAEDPAVRIVEIALLKAARRFSYAEHRLPKLFRSRRKMAEIEGMTPEERRAAMDRMIDAAALDALGRVRALAARLRGAPVEAVWRGGVDAADPAAFRDLPPCAAVVTSPPYLQAQEYIRTFRLELAWLGHPAAEIRRLARREIPYRKAEDSVSTPTLDEVRRRLGREDLRARVDAYFYYTLRALENAAGRLRPGGVLCVFVGNATAEGIEVETWRIIREHFEARGFVPVAALEDRIPGRRLFRGRRNKNPDGIRSEILLVMRREEG